MISLISILKEAVGQPKAIILAGAPGAGKGFILRGLDLGGLKVLNIDNIFINMLKQANVSLDLKNATPEERSQQAKSMAAANKEFKGDMVDVIQGKESFILDGTAASLKNTLKLKDELEEAGYEVFMLYVYTDLERSLKQNQDRFEKSGGEDRSLAPAIVMSTWKNVTKNYNPYKERILLIKLDALGDVVRSTALAEGIKKKYPDCTMSMITNGSLLDKENNKQRRYTEQKVY